MNITITGDFTTKNRGAFAVESETALKEDVLAVLTDVNIINIEAPVADKNDGKIKKIGPHLNLSENALLYLKKCGFNCVTLANNHFYDYGDCGVKKTINQLNQLEYQFVGGGQTEQEKKKTLSLNTEDTELIILNYCESEFSVKEDIGSNPMNPINVFYDIQNAKKKDCFVLVITHGGHEGYNLPSPRMQELYRFFIDSGADAVVNHHQHCYSGYEKYGNGYIFYGLGNFFFDAMSPKVSNIWHEGYILNMNIERNKIISFEIHPYIQCQGNEVYVRLMNQKEKDVFSQNMEVLNSIISNKRQLKNAFDKFCTHKKKEYISWFTPYSNRYLKALYRRGFLPSFLSKKKKMEILNILRCESHRDISIFVLNKEHEQIH